MAKKLSKTTKNGQKWSKNGPNGPKGQNKNKKSFFFSFAIVSYFVGFQFVITKMAKTGPKQPKTAKNGIFDRFWRRKKLTPPG